MGYDNLFQKEGGICFYALGTQRLTHHLTFMQC